MRSLILAVLLLWALPAQAQQAMPCGPYDQFRKEMADTPTYIVALLGTLFNGVEMELWSGANGDGIVVMVDRKENKVCILGTGGRPKEKGA